MQHDSYPIQLYDFFFQAEDGIRGFHVTGVQTCALPILPLAGMATPRLSTVRVEREAIGRGAVRLLAEHMDGERAVQQLEIGVSMVEGETVFRSEERRVGNVRRSPKCKKHLLIQEPMGRL